MENFQQHQINDQVLVFDGSTKNERRKHPRYKTNKNILFISEDILAEVVDVSGSGISCKFLARFDKLLGQMHQIELLDCELGTSIKGLYGRLVRFSNKAICLASPLMMIMNFSLEFQDLTQIQQKRLFQFIENG
jgi:hypothetical protein